MPKEISLEGIKVCIAIPCYSGVVPIEMMLAMSDLMARVHLYGVQLSILGVRENGIITAVRNSLLSQFLETDFDYLFWIDDDIIFTPQDFISVLAAAVDKKSAAATYCTRTDDAPVFFMHPLKGFPLQFTDEGLLEVSGVGLGFACQHRSIVEELVKGKEIYTDKDGSQVYDVFKIGVHEGKYMGEDTYYFNQIYANGHITYVHPLINLKHVGRKDYSHKLLTEKE